MVKISIDTLLGTERIGRVRKRDTGKKIVQTGIFRGSGFEWVPGGSGGPPHLQLNKFLALARIR